MNRAWNCVTIHAFYFGQSCQLQPTLPSSSAPSISLLWCALKIQRLTLQYWLNIEETKFKERWWRLPNIQLAFFINHFVWDIYLYIWNNAYDAFLSLLLSTVCYEICERSFLNEFVVNIQDSSLNPGMGSILSFLLKWLSKLCSAHLKCKSAEKLKDCFLVGC